MFTTLQHSRSSDEAYTVKEIQPPFHRKRQGKLARIACTQCREKKVKCSAEPDGCQRCAAKQIECHYPAGAASSSSHRRSESSSAETTVDVDSLSWTPSSLSSVVDESFNFMDSEFADGADLDILGNASAYTPTFSGSLVFDAADTPSSSTFRYASGTAVTSEGLNLDLSYEDSHPIHGASISPTITRSGDSESTLVSDSPFDASPGKAPAFDRKHEVCTCFASAISVYEGIAIRLIGGHHDASTSIDQILQHQKMVLQRCDGLLSCRQCCSRSDFMMLIISMCDRMLSSLQNIISEITNSYSYSPELSENVQPPLKMHRENIQRSLQSRPESSSGRKRLKIGAWQLDDEDEKQVLQTLLRSRLAGLGAFINSVENLVDKTSWPPHEAILRELQERFHAATLKLG